FGEVVLGHQGHEFFELADVDHLCPTGAGLAARVRSIYFTAETQRTQRGEELEWTFPVCVLSASSASLRCSFRSVQTERSSNQSVDHSRSLGREQKLRAPFSVITY